MSVKQRATKVARNKDSAKPVRTPPFDVSTIKPHKHGTGFTSCAACSAAGTASTCAHVDAWPKQAPMVKEAPAAAAPVAAAPAAPAPVTEES